VVHLQENIRLEIIIMGQIGEIILKLLVHIRSTEALKNPWLLPIAIVVIILILWTVFIDRDARYFLSTFGGALRRLLRIIS